MQPTAKWLSEQSCTLILWWLSFTSVVLIREAQQVAVAMSTQLVGAKSWVASISWYRWLMPSAVLVGVVAANSVAGWSGADERRSTTSHHTSGRQMLQRDDHHWRWLHLHWLE